MIVDLTTGLTITGLSVGSALTVSLTIARLWVKDEAQKALKETVYDLQKQIDSIEDKKQCKEFCTLSHNSINTRFDTVEMYLKSIQELLMKR